MNLLPRWSVLLVVLLAACPPQLDPCVDVWGGTYSAQVELTTPAGTTSRMASFTVSAGSVTDATGDFTGTVEASGAFRGQSKVCQGCDPLPITGTFLDSGSFILRGSSASGGVTQTITARRTQPSCTGPSGGGGGGVTGGGGGGGSGGGAGFTVASLSPPTQLEGGQVKIVGTGFPLAPGLLSVTVCGVEAMVTVVSSTELTFLVPPLLRGSDCQVVITIRGADGGVIESITWTGLLAVPLPRGLNAVVHRSADTFLTVGEQGAIFTTANAGGAWEDRTQGTAELFAVAANGVIVGAAGTILTTADFITWTPRSSGTTQHLRGVAANASLTVAVGDSGTILSSPDGVTWTSRAAGTMAFFDAVTWGNSEFVAVGSTSVFTSPDGETWTSRPSLPNGGYCVIWNGSTYLVGSTFGTFFQSTDWSTTTAFSNGDGSYVRALAWSGAHFIEVGELGVIMTSPTGQAWTRVTSGTTAWLKGVATNGATTIAVGGGQTVVRF